MRSHAEDLALNALDCRSQLRHGAYAPNGKAQAAKPLQLIGNAFQGCWREGSTGRVHLLRNDFDATAGLRFSGRSCIRPLHAQHTDVLGQGSAELLPCPATLEVCRCLKRSEEHTSELQSLMRISDAVF